MRQLRAERLKRGWSLTKVTTLTGIATTDISRLERGLGIPFPGWQRRLALAFKVPANELFREAPTDSSPGRSTACAQVASPGSGSRPSA
jgi:transcriptional regulator with XRE-family HTH domain